MREVTEREIFCEEELPEPEQITKIKNSVYPGMILIVQKPVTNQKCKARVVDTYPHIVALEDVDKPGKIFTMRYFDLTGRKESDG